jgi:DNA-binding MarR family transcriptional regulator
LRLWVFRDFITLPAFFLESLEMAKRQVPRYLMAFADILKRKEITPSEKLVLIVLGRFWPKPYFGSNETIANETGLSKIYVKKLIKRLFDKKIIRRGLTTITQRGKPYTSRVIVISLLPKYVLESRILWYTHRGYNSIPDRDTIISPNKEENKRENRKNVIKFKEVRRTQKRTIESEKSLEDRQAAAREQKEKLGIA